MKCTKIFLLGIIIMVLGSCHNRTKNEIKVRILQPGPKEGIDTYVQSNNRYENVNFGTLTTIVSISWTDDLNDSHFNNSSILINFPQLNRMNKDIIDSVKLTLYAVPNYPYLSGGQFGFNSNTVHCITEKWDQNTVTWINQPAIDTYNYVVIPVNNDYDSIVVNLTPLIHEEMKLKHGFMISQRNNRPYSSSVFYSSNDSIASTRPKLTIYYK